MLKLTRHLFAWAPSAESMDFYERALLNHILGSQDPKTGQVIYYCPLKPGAFKTFSTPTDSFWCCVGTGMENHGKYNDTIYFHDDDALYVNLFIPSELTWKAKGLKVRQESKFPEEETTRLTLTAGRPVKLALKVRYPSWAGAAELTVNSQPQRSKLRRGRISRSIASGRWRHSAGSSADDASHRGDAGQLEDGRVHVRPARAGGAARHRRGRRSASVGPSTPAMSRAAIDVATIVADDVESALKKVTP